MMQRHFVLYALSVLLVGLACVWAWNWGRTLLEGMTSSSSSSSSSSALVLYGPEGGVLRVAPDRQSAVLVRADGSRVRFTVSTEGADPLSSADPMLQGDNGDTAQIQTSASGETTVIVSNLEGTTVYRVTKTEVSSSGDSDATATNNYDNYNHYDQTSYPTVFYGPNGLTARVLTNPSTGEKTVVVTPSGGASQTYTFSVDRYVGPRGGSATLVRQNGSQVLRLTSPQGQTVVLTGTPQHQSVDATLTQQSAESAPGQAQSLEESMQTQSAYPGQLPPTPSQTQAQLQAQYQASLPPGIPRSQIPPGQEDLYILKSEVVPPVCPRCPDPVVYANSSDKSDTTKCPPCPPCARCPEPSFTCAKVPNYSAFNPNTMPVPVLSSFSSFGM